MTTATLGSVAMLYAYVPMPRMLMLLFAGCDVLVIVTDGATFTMSSKSRMLARSRVASVTTNTEAGTSWICSRRLPAVTITSSTTCDSLGTGSACRVTCDVVVAGRGGGAFSACAIR